MRNFRQGTDGRDFDGKQPHRSRWPEADSLRRITGEAQTGHDRSTTGSSNAFPRGELGLPIQFRFKDWDDQKNNCELLPVDADRMASPVILRPLAIAANRALPMVVTLNTPGLRSARLKTKRLRDAPDPSPMLDNRAVPASEIRNAAAAAVPGSPLAGTSGSALEAFLKYAGTRV
jgi:CRISPR-associated protein Cmr1